MSRKWCSTRTSNPSRTNCGSRKPPSPDLHLYSKIYYVCTRTFIISTIKIQNIKYIIIMKHIQRDSDLGPHLGREPLPRTRGRLGPTQRCYYLRFAASIQYIQRDSDPGPHQWFASFRQFESCTNFVSCSTLDHKK